MINSQILNAAQKSYAVSPGRVFYAGSIADIDRPAFVGVTISDETAGDVRVLVATDEARIAGLISNGVEAWWRQNERMGVPGEVSIKFDDFYTRTDHDSMFKPRSYAPFGVWGAAGARTMESYLAMREVSLSRAAMELVGRMNQEVGNSSEWPTSANEGVSGDGDSFRQALLSDVIGMRRPHRNACVNANAAGLSHARGRSSGPANGDNL